MFDNAFLDNIGEVWTGFQITLWLLLFSGVSAGVVGVILGSFRVSPVRALRAIGVSYVTVFRNTPLVLILALGVAVIPKLGFTDLSFSVGIAGFNTFFTMAMLGLAAYTAAFVCEAVRSGVNSVSPGQAEAARSVGMSFVQTLRFVVLPQAIRAVIPPLTSIYIALAKNTSIVATVGVADAAYTMRKLGNEFTSDIYFIFLGFALGYVAVVLTLSGCAALFERRMAVAR